MLDPRARSNLSDLEILQTKHAPARFGGPLRVAFVVQSFVKAGIASQSCGEIAQCSPQITLRDGARTSSQIG